MITAARFVRCCQRPQRPLGFRLHNKTALYTRRLACSFEARLLLQQPAVLSACRSGTAAADAGKSRAGAPDLREVAVPLPPRE